MRSSNSYLSLLALACMLFLFSCKPEAVSPNGQAGQKDSPTLAGAAGDHPVFGPECSDRITYELMDENGGTDIDYFGISGVPPVGGPVAWGSVDLVNSDLELAIEINLPFGWNIDYTKSYFGTEAGLTLNNGIPVSQTNWLFSDIGETTLAQILVPLTSLNTSATNNCTNFVIQLSVVQYNFVTGIDEASRTSLWVSNSSWNDPNDPDANTSSAFVNNWCIKYCGPVITTITDGNCQGCNSENTVVFSDCISADVSSCKDLSNVVLLFVDNTYQKFDGLSDKTGSFAGTGAHDGKDIARCYVKSGCFKSGDGPGWGLRFDSPCNDDNLITVPGTGGGGNGGGGNGGGKGKNK